MRSEAPIYFCDPHASWQRGSNENTNGLLRQYLPKGTDLSTPSAAELEAIQHSLNHRPRKTLGYMTPSEAYAQVVAATDSAWDPRVLLTLETRMEHGNDEWCATSVAEVPGRAA